MSRCGSGYMQRRRLRRGVNEQNRQGAVRPGSRQMDDNPTLRPVIGLTVAYVGTLGTLMLGGEEGVREDYRDGDQQRRHEHHSID
jgi:hypothetical protein